MGADDLTFYERLRIQMEYVVPLVRDLQRQLGEEAVNEALASRLEQQVERRAAPGSKADFSRMRAGTEMFAAGGALELRAVSESDDHFSMDVVDCAYTRMMDELDARDLGPMLICNLDYPDAARMGMQLERTQTRMQGASHCDFRYSRRPD